MPPVLRTTVNFMASVNHGLTAYIIQCKPMTLPINAEAFAPGDYIREELEARGWSQLDLAEILGRPPRAVNEIISGKRSITPDTAKALGDAFGTSAQLWMNLDSAFQLAKPIMSQPSQP